MEIIFNFKKIMKIVDILKPQPTRKGNVWNWDYHDLQSNIEVDVNTWDDHNNYAQMLINTSIIYEYLHQLINCSIATMMCNKLILVFSRKLLRICISYNKNSLTTT
jgi:hypothetical protein